jgi:uncharacterized protein (DUF433 family)
MTLTIIAEPVPLAADQYGTIRVAGMRVTLDSVIASYKNGDSPEQIAENFPGLELADIYAVLAYYLRHQAEVETYLQEQKALAAEVRKKVAAVSNPPGLREKLLAKRNSQK